MAADGTSCAYARVPYDSAPSASTLTTMAKYFDWATYISPIRQASALWNWATGTDGVTTEIAQQYGVEVNQNMANSLVLFQKDQNGNYLQSREINILATKWFQADGTPYPVGNWVQTKSRTASVWYCAQQGKLVDGTVNPDPTQAYKAGNADITQFSSLCNGHAYFEIAAIPGQLTPPQSFSEAVQQNAKIVSANPNNTVATSNNLPACGFGTGVVAGAAGVQGTISGCAAQVAYGIYWLCAWVAGLFGELFDFFIGYSVSSASYSYPFVVTGWTLVRDISNIFFIIIMVWTGFSAVFDFGGSGGSMKKVVPALIINAFLINFSLFFTRVVIDISNVTARMFYSEMIVCKQSDLVGGVCPPAKAQTGLGGYWPLSEKIVSSFNPQSMFKPSVLNPPTTSTDSTQNTTQAVTNTGTQLGASQVAIYFGVISLIAAAIMIVIAIMFFKIAFLFLGRVVGLYICMIFSPFAFLSRDIPMLGSVPRIQWKHWKEELTNYALLAPVFVFFLYIIYTFLSSNFVQQIGVQALASSGFFATVMSIVIPMVIIYFLITSAQKIAVSLSGDIGKSIQGFGETATGLVTGAALGIATGGASLAGTSAAGALKISGETRTNLEARKAAGGFGGQMASWRLQASDWTQKQTFDARNTKAMQALNKQFSANPNNRLVTALGFGSDRTKGGREGQIKRNEEKQKKDINAVKSDMKDPEAAAYWEKHLQTKKMQKRLEKEAEALYLAKPENAGKAVDKNSEEFKKEKENAVNAYGKVTNNKELTQALRVKYADTISKSSNLVARDFLSSPSLMGAFTDNVGKKKAAKTFLEDQKKSLDPKKKNREARLIEDVEKDKKELGAIEETLKGIYTNTAKLTVPAKAENVGKSREEIDRLVEAEVVRLQSKDNVNEANRIVTEHRTELKNNYDLLDLDVANLNTQHKEALKRSNDNEDDIAVRGARRALSEKIAERNKVKVEYDDLDGKRKRDLENNINRNEGELEKIADKKKSEESKADGAKKEEKKDDKK